MNTPAHLIFGWAAFGKRNQGKVTTGALLGAFAPDVSLYAMTAVSIWVLGIPARRVFGELYYSDSWQLVFAIDNSFVLWGIACLIAVRLQNAWAMAFTGAALLHLAFDFPLHTHDARQHFWPLTNWKFEGPISYWDSHAHADVVGPIVLGMAVAAIILIWRRHGNWALRGLAVLLLAAETMSSGLWRLVF